MGGLLWPYYPIKRVFYADTHHSNCNPINKALIPNNHFTMVSPSILHVSVTSPVHASDSPIYVSYLLISILLSILLQMQMNSESKMKPWKPAMEETQIGAFCGSLPANIFESVQSPMTAIDRQKRCSDCISNEYHFVVFCNKCFAINCCRCIFKNKNKCSICQEVQENMK